MSTWITTTTTTLISLAWCLIQCIVSYNDVFICCDSTNSYKRHKMRELPARYDGDLKEKERGGL